MGYKVPSTLFVTEKNRLFWDGNSPLGHSKVIAVSLDITKSKGVPKHIAFTFPWSPGNMFNILKEYVKGMEGAKYCTDPHIHWRVNYSQRNLWQIQYMDESVANPYLQFRSDYPSVEPKRDCLYAHQREALSIIMARKTVILASEMGTGKTLVMIEALEKVKPRLAWYVAPRFAILAVQKMFKDWNSEVWPVFMSYEKMVSNLKNWDGSVAPDFVIFDESAYLKTPNSLRTQYAMSLTDSMRLEHESPYIILASGAPAPHSPRDWWAQSEVARPGFLKERDIHAFNKRYALMTQQESPVGGTYNKLVTWWDNPEKCSSCGELATHLVHTNKNALDYHTFRSSCNEVAKLYTRLKGLAIIQFKKDCLDLPDKVYRTINLEVSPRLKQMAAHIVRNSATTIEGLTRLRELSDGFQYAMEKSETRIPCKACKGTGVDWDPITNQQAVCDRCDGLGTEQKEERVANKIVCPKDAALKELLEECEEHGRIVIYAGFTASVDKCVEICKNAGWVVIRADGYAKKICPDGIWTSSPVIDPLNAFQDKERKIAKMAFVAHPATAKTALTLTESWMLVYYSNTFNGDDRIQSEDRIHRIGMDVNKGAVIVDLVHLPTDEYVLTNLKGKRKLQSLTLGDFQNEALGFLT